MATAAEVLHNGSLMGERVRAHDWASSPLGATARWPQSLRTALSIVLGSVLPTYLVWGRELTSFHNDAYLPLLGHKREALGRPLSAVWPEAWDVIGPVTRKALRGEAGRHESAPLVMARATERSRAWTSFTYTPVRDETGDVAGVLYTALEPSRSSAEHAEENEGRLRTAAELIGLSAFSWDSRTGVIECDDRLRTMWGLPPSSRLDRDLALSAIPREDLARLRAALARCSSPARKGVCHVDHRVIGIGDGIERWISTHGRMTFENGRPAKLVGVAIEVTESKQAEQCKLGSHERLGFLLKLGDRLHGVSDPREAIRIAAEMLGGHLGADRVGYLEINPDDQKLNINDAWNRPGMPNVVGRYHLDDLGPVLLETLRMGHTARHPDILTLTSDLATPIVTACRTYRIAAAVNVPLVRHGELAAILYVHQSHPRDWTDAQVSLIRDVADRIWSSLQRAYAESALRDSEARLAAIFSKAAVGISEISLDGRFLSVNDELCRILGRSREDLLGLDVEKVTHQEDFPASHDALTRIIRDGGPVSLDKRYLRPDGTPVWANSLLTRLDDWRDQPRSLLAVTVDLTARKAAESALRDSEERLRTLTEGIPQLVWRAVHGGRWTWSSPQWSAYTGLSEGSSHGHGWIAALHPDDREAALESWTNAEAGAALTMETRLFSRAQGRYRWFTTRATPVRDRQGRVVEWLGTSTDIDDLRRLQQQQEVLVAELQHRTRNLIGVIISMADKALQGSKTLEGFSGKFMDRLGALARVQGLLSRLREDQRITFDELIETEIRALDGNNSRISLDGPSGVALRSSTVQTLALALHELATNAAKYGALSQDGGQLTIRWRLHPGQAEAGPWLEVDWKESGVVMPPAGAGPQGSGEGRELIERALPYQLGAKTRFELGPDGVHCTIALPVSEHGAGKQEP